MVGGFFPKVDEIDWDRIRNISGGVAVSPHRDM